MGDVAAAAPRSRGRFPVGQKGRIVVADAGRRLRDDDPPPPAPDRGFGLGFVGEKHDAGGASGNEVEVEVARAAARAIGTSGSSPARVGWLTEEEVSCCVGAAGSGNFSRLPCCARSGALGGDAELELGAAGVVSGPVGVPLRTAALPA